MNSSLISRWPRCFLFKLPSIWGYQISGTNLFFHILVINPHHSILLLALSISFWLVNPHCSCSNPSFLLVKSCEMPIFHGWNQWKIPFPSAIFSIFAGELPHLSGTSMRTVYPVTEPLPSGSWSHLGKWDDHRLRWIFLWYYMIWYEMRWYGIICVM